MFNQIRQSNGRTMSKGIKVSTPYCVCLHHNEMSPLNEEIWSWYLYRLATKWAASWTDRSFGIHSFANVKPFKE